MAHCEAGSKVSLDNCVLIWILQLFASLLCLLRDFTSKNVLFLRVEAPMDENGHF